MSELRDSSNDRLNDIHEKAIRRFDEIYVANLEQRQRCIEDRRFCDVPGAQWDGDLLRMYENKPRPEINKVHLAVIRVINDYRNTNLHGEFLSRNGDKDDDLADTCAQLFRSDEQDSNADEAYNNAIEEGIKGGFGAVRLSTYYEDEEEEEDDYQRIRIEPIFDADQNVWFDIDAKRQDKSDAKYCYVITPMSLEQYKEEFDDDPTYWPATTALTYDWWDRKDTVRVAEYFIVEEVKDTIRVFRGLNDEEKKIRDSELEEDSDQLEVLQATGFREVRQKKIKVKKIRKYILSGSKVLRDDGYIPGSYIPVVPYYGKYAYINNIEYCSGIVATTKDAQRNLNVAFAKIGEINSYSPVEKPIFSPEQMVGHEEMWSTDHIKEYGYMLNNIVRNPDGSIASAGPLGYTKAPNIPPALGALLQISDTHLKELMGNQESAEEIQPNLSGRAIELIQTRLDNQSYIYMSNAAIFKKQIMRCWLSMGKKIYIEDGRVMRGIGTQDQVSEITLMKPTLNKKNEHVFENDLSMAKFDIRINIGPSSITKRQSLVNTLSSLMQYAQDPQTIQILTTAVIMNTEGEGMKDYHDYFRKNLLRMGVLKPTDEEAQELMAEAQNKQPDPQAQYLQAAAQQAMADATKAKADTILTIAKSEETRAKTAETIASIDRQDRDQVINAIDKALSRTETNPINP